MESTDASVRALVPDVKRESPAQLDWRRRIALSFRSLGYGVNRVRTLSYYNYAYGVMVSYFKLDDPLVHGSVPIKFENGTYTVTQCVLNSPDYYHVTFIEWKKHIKKLVQDGRTVLVREEIPYIPPPAHDICLSSITPSNPKYIGGRVFFDTAVTSLVPRPNCFYRKVNGKLKASKFYLSPYDYTKLIASARDEYIRLSYVKNEAIVGEYITEKTMRCNSWYYNGVVFEMSGALPKFLEVPTGRHYKDVAVLPKAAFFSEDALKEELQSYRLEFSGSSPSSIYHPGLKMWCSPVWGTPVTPPASYYTVKHHTPEALEEICNEYFSF